MNDSSLRRAVRFSPEILKNTALRNEARPISAPTADTRPAKTRAFSSAESASVYAYILSDCALQGFESKRCPPMEPQAGCSKYIL